MPGDVRRKVDAGRSRRPRCAKPGVQVQRHDARRRPQPARLRARDEPARARAPGSDAEREILAFHYEGKDLNSPNDVVRPLGRHDLLLRPLVRAHARLRHRARARARLAGRVHDPARRRPERPAPGGRTGRVRDAERALLLARRVAALHQRHAGRATSTSTTSLPTGRSRTAACFAEGIGDGDLEEGGLVDGMKCDEQRQHLGHGPRRRLGVQRGGRAPRRGRDPGERRATSPGAAPTGTRCSCRRPRPSTP